MGFGIIPHFNSQFIMINSNYLNSIEWKFSDNLIKYDQALSFMEDRVANIINQKQQQLIWILEHYPVYTAGVSAKDSDLLDAKNIDIFKTNRGGKYTYHCPAMKIIYVMLDLKKFFHPKKPDVSLFVKFLETWVIATLDNYNIKGQLKNNRVGIWVDDNQTEKKIAALGIKLKKWVSYHGIAINIAPDLEGFKKIIPCGISEYGVTSMKDLKIINNYDDNFSKNFDKILQKKFFDIYKIFNA